MIMPSASNDSNQLLDQAASDLDRGDFTQAEHRLRQLLAQNPERSDAAALLGETLRRLGKLADSERVLRDVIQADPTLVRPYALLHKTLTDAGRYAEALVEIETALSREPENADFLYQRALTQEGLGQLSECLASIEAALTIRPGWLAALSLKASALRLMGHGDQAVDLLRTLIAEEPTNASLWGKLILALQGDSRASLADIAEATRAALGNASEDNRSVASPTGAPNRKINLAFVSGDFKEHPVAYFLDGVLQHLNRDRFQVTLVPTIPGSDARTEAFKKRADTWHPIFNMTDEEAKESLRTLSVDIAIDLCGWTRGHRIGLFQNRIAPIQATWIGYSGSTGLSTMDYIICDRTVLPPDHEPDYSEKPLRLPNGYLSMESPADILESALGHAPSRPPPQQNRIVFGSFNTLAKLTDEVLDAWTEIITRVEGSLLYLRARQFNDGAVKTDLTARLHQRGFPLSQLVLEGNKTRKGMLAAYLKVDIALDPFPYGGTTTTFETLAMGVPVITLLGDRWVGRVGASILETIGYTDLIAATIDDYIDKAVDLASDHPRLSELRSNTADIMRHSPACDTHTFTKGFEHALGQIWAAQSAAQ